MHQGQQLNKLNSSEHIKSGINDYILFWLKKNSSSQLRESLVYHFQQPGKSLRAMLSIYLAEVYSVDEKSALLWASSCELLHNASIIHDDLQDQDEYRRGQMSLWKKYGSYQAIVAGDYLITASTVILEDMPQNSDLKWNLSLLLNRSAMRLGAGQSEEQDLRKILNSDDMWDKYLECISNKTGVLFELPILGISKIAGLNNTLEDSLINVFSKIGLLFQMQDDVIDLYGNKGRLEVGEDIKEGKISALVLKYIQLRPENRDELFKTLDLSKDQTTKEMIAYWINEFQKSTALSSVLSEINSMEQSILKLSEEFEQDIKNVIKILLSRITISLSHLE